MNELAHTHMLVLGRLSFAAILLFTAIGLLDAKESEVRKQCLKSVLFSASCALGVMTASYWMEKVLPSMAASVKRLE